MSKAVTRSYRIKQSKDFVLLALKNIIKDADIETDPIRIKLKPSFLIPGDPSGIIHLSIISEGRDQCIVKSQIIAEPKLQQYRYFFAVVICLIFLIVLITSFTFLSLIAAIVASCMLLFVFYLHTKLNEGKLDNYLNDLIKKIGSKHYTVPGLH